MQALVIDDLNEEMATEAVFGGASDKVHNYLLDRVTHYVDTLHEGVKQQYGGFHQNIIDRYRKVRSAKHIRMIDAAGAQLKHYWQTNNIRPLKLLSEIQQAPTAMMPWIMAMPKLRTLHKDDRIDGYGEDYVDPYPEEGSGKDNYPYRRVMTGMFDKGSYTTYIEPLREPEDKLTLHEQLTIRSAWQAIDLLLKENKKDPTSKWNGLVS